jgi:hypothetical protein
LLAIERSLNGVAILLLQLFMQQAERSKRTMPEVL